MTLNGTIESIRCYKPDSGWAAVTVSHAGGRMNVSGLMPGVRVGMCAEFVGEVTDTKWGPSFKAASFSEARPSDAEGIEKYLASGLIKNIGPVLAKTIVDHFGEQTLEVMDSAPERLAEIHGIGKKRIASIVASAREQKVIRSIMIWLKRYDLSNSLAAKIYKTYGEQSIGILEENPYRLSDDIHGVGFKRADDVARRLGIPADSPFRIRSGILARLEDAAGAGDTYMDINKLVTETAGTDYLSIPPALVERQLRQPDFRDVVMDGTDVALPLYYNAEKRIASCVTALGAPPSGCDPGLPDFRRIKGCTGFDYSEEQRTAVCSALWTNLLVLTGGPGTGKTATTNAIINELEHRGLAVMLAAPTGRAAKRMSEVTGRPARTIHRLLEYSQGKFQRDAGNPVDADALVIDEASMIDTLLMRSLLVAVKPGAKVILVGDVDQLPSVGAGCVLRDLIDSGRVMTVRLTNIFRQAQGSDIVMNAHRVNRGVMPVLEDRPGSDFWFIEAERKETAAGYVLDLVQNYIPASTGLRHSDIQVLSPMRRPGDILGSTELNRTLQQALNAGGTVAARRGDVEFRVGDRVMQVKNNYDKDIFNGDIGTVTRPLPGTDDDKAVMEADFGFPVRFTQGELEDLELAYACTVHKSQGSEYRAVVMPCHNNHFVMLKRNLLYTGITRAKDLCVLVGTKDAVRNAVWREDTVRRCTRLRERILECGAPAAGGTFRDTLF